MRNDWTPEEIARLIEMDRAGRALAEIAAALNRSLPAVKRRRYGVVKAGLLPPLTGPANRHAEIAALFDAGKTDREIAAVTGYKVTTVRVRRGDMALKRIEQPAGLKRIRGNQELNPRIKMRVSAWWHEGGVLCRTIEAV